MKEQEKAKEFQKLKKKFEEEKEEIIEFLDDMEVWEGEQKEKIPYEKLPEINKKIKEELED